MPTGVALRDVREHLFAAAERILIRDGAAALTSRAVTTEAGVAKGVLHRHFADFDGFLADLIRDRIAGLSVRAAALRESAGTGTVVENLAGTLTAVFNSVAVSLISLMIFRDDLRARLRAEYPAGVPLLVDVVAMVADYLSLERAAGRLEPDADAQMLAHTLIGSSHLLFAGHRDTPPAGSDVSRMIAAVITPALR
ncbi:AcrR family transcriptional regulator [Catenuloplanes nepalensis]|uniref:AcrR family transcriptional regulator n=1 Tax=Catenuloplanes nepalensis TaxID=587533 RepID=A0ABT9MVZ6_9ACTN|nr:TetR/AcrR family transcriptional regulator [Catenuloplanes nepalensis]MDP9795605.1 AcrR family transcriptional regulator [Catenuloplanes nepalensis]